MFCRPTNLWTAVVEPHDGDEGVAHICTGPAEVAEAAKAAAEEEIANAYAKLMHLNYGDAGYGDLKALYGLRPFGGPWATWETAVGKY